MIRVVLPYHLRTLAKRRRRGAARGRRPGDAASILDALEARYPVLRGTIRDHVTGNRRPLLRFFACDEDLSHESPDAPLPDAVATGAEPFFIVGAIAGGQAGSDEEFRIKLTCHEAPDFCHRSAMGNYLNSSCY